ncbi:TetR/AcrR family transcriptional regulator [Desulforamulus ruminis]|uniref:Regulatory protein TetR n=1 Tax=Desulforamulus ruminis (strain ATCC 23193 / DSM 2154 / NCIMB 8452 / DL) TaxID=696281 RepID=F6DRW2_DESRL|nr:TetR/AcrR family transcriptional regulator [Desulforamulus ruminis]AEG60986.1 regulatory protein TetR [Desulforamulus ruminis DSM 2154]
MKKTNRQLQKEQTREALLEKAFEVFAQRGIMNTRMSDIAQAAGVSHGTVFAHFRTQEVLITEVIETYGRKIALRTHELADSCEHMEEVLAAHLAGIMEFEPFYTRLVIENRLLPLAARDVWVSVQSAISFHFSQVAERERQRGRGIDIPTHLLFNMWVGLVHYYLANSDLFAPEGHVIKRYGKTLIDNYSKLIQRSPEEK